VVLITARVETPEGIDLDAHTVPLALITLFEYRSLGDLRRAWRVAQPNLEQAGLLRIEYEGLDAIAADDGAWSQVPVIRDVDKKSVRELAAEIAEFADKARQRKLAVDDMKGGTFTVSNLGMFGDVDSFVAIINPPHTGILAVGKAVPRPVVRDGQLAVATTMKLTLSADHRVTDGAEAAQYLNEVKRLLENPLLLVL